MPESTPDTDISILNQRLAELQELVQVIGRINRSLELDDVLHAGLAGIQQVLGGKFGCFILIDPALQKLELAYAESMPPPLYERLQLFAANFRSPLANSQALNEINLIIILGDQVREILKDDYAESATLIPLTARGRPVGILLVGIGVRRPSTPSGVDLLMSIGEQVGMAIENARLHTSLARSEQFHRAFVENSPDGILEGSLDGQVTYVNSAACALLGYSHDELMQLRPFDMLADPGVVAIIDDELHRLGVSSNRLAKGRVKGGGIRTFSLSCRLVRDSEAIRYQVIFRDVTEQQHSIDTLDRRNQELGTLNAIGKILSHPLEIGGALDQVCEQLSLNTGMETTAIFLADASAQGLYLVAHRGVEPELFDEIQHVGMDDPIVHAIAVDGEILAADDVMLYTEQGLAGPRRMGYHAGIGVPIKRRSGPMGAVFVGSKLRYHYEKPDLALLLNVGERIGMALENHELYSEMQRRVEELDGLSQLSAACALSLDPKAISQLAVDWTRRLLHADSCKLYLLENGDLRLDAILGQPEQTVVQERVPLGPPFQNVIATRSPLVIDDVAEAPALGDRQRAHMQDVGVRSGVTVALPTPSGIIGVLVVGHSHSHAWQQREIDLLQTVANQTANAIRNAQLYQNVVAEQRKVQALFDSGLSGLFATDADGRIVMFNRAAERITGWTLQDVYGKKWADVLLDSGSETEPLINVALVQKQAAYVPYGRKIQTRDGRVIPVAKAVAPLITADGTVTGAVGAFWDLTRETVAEQSRENFLRMIAHQMRNPLTVLVSALGLLDKPNLPRQRRDEMYALVKSQAERLQKFSEQFLDLERAIHSLRPVHCEAVAMVPLVKKLVGEFEAGYTSRRFVLETCQPEPTAYADSERVDNILRNLLDNAVTYSADGSQITVSVRIIHDRDQVDIGIHDQGVGIPFPEQEHIFDAFYRASQPEGRQTYGHGFGLYIARQMAQQMSGDIEFTSREREGSAFHLILRRVS